MYAVACKANGVWSGCRRASQRGQLCPTCRLAEQSKPFFACPLWLPLKALRVSGRVPGQQRAARVALLRGHRQYLAQRTRPGRWCPAPRLHTSPRSRQWRIRGQHQYAMCKLGPRAGKAQLHGSSATPVTRLLSARAFPQSWTRSYLLLPAALLRLSTSSPLPEAKFTQEITSTS